MQRNRQHADGWALVELKMHRGTEDLIGLSVEVERMRTPDRPLEDAGEALRD